MKKNSNSYKALKGMSDLTIVTVMSGIVEILYFSIMSRLLSKAEFGLFAAIVAVSSIFKSISEAGVGAALIQKKEVDDSYKNSSFTLSIIIGAVVTLLFFLLSDFFADTIVGPELRIPLKVMSITIFFSGMNSVYYSWMKRKLQFLKIGVLSLISYILASTVGITMAMYGYGVIAILTRAVLVSVISVLLACFFVDTRFHLFLDKRYVKNIFNFGGWLTVSVIIRNIADQVDRLMMSRLLSIEALGAYNRPKDFVLRIAGHLSGIFDSAMFPVLSSIQDEKERMKRAFNVSQYHLNLFSMALSLLFICNTDLLIRVFFGENWLNLRSVFQVVSLTLIFNTNSRLTDCYFRSLGIVRVYSSFRVLQLFLNVLAILIGFKFGVIGVAVSFLTSNILYTYFKTLYISKEISINKSDLIKNIIGGWWYVVYFVPLVFLQYTILPNTWMWNFVSFVVYLLMIFSLFIVFPSLLGKQYKESTYASVKSFIMSKMNSTLRRK